MLKSYAKANGKVLKWAESNQIPVHIVKSNNMYQIQKALRDALQLDQEDETFQKYDDEMEEAMQEISEAVDSLVHVNIPLELLPREMDIIKMQQKVAHQNNLVSEIVGRDDEKRLRIYPRGNA